MQRLSMMLILTFLMISSLSGMTGAQVTYELMRQDHPVFTVASYYSAINRGDYALAYSYWSGGGAPDQTLEQFARGFATTRHVQALVRLPLYTGVAAGSTYSRMPIILIATETDNTQQLFAGCFTTRKANVPAGNATEPDPNWYLYEASLRPVERVDFSLAVAQCPEVEALPMSAPYQMSTHPIDTLTSYYDAIARQDYAAAYRYWGGNNRRQTLPQFQQGFAGTANIGVVVDLNILVRSDTAYSYAEIPVLLTATSNGIEQWFTGCYVFRRANGSADVNWTLNSANTALFENARAGVAQVNQVCESARG